MNALISQKKDIVAQVAVFFFRFYFRIFNQLTFVGLFFDLRYTIHVAVLQYAVCSVCSLSQLFVKRPERVHGTMVALYRRRCGVMVASSMRRDGRIDIGMTFFQTYCARSDA